MLSSLLCSHIRLCPHRQCLTASDGTFTAADDAVVVQLKGRRRASLSRDVQLKDGIMQTTLKLTVSVDDPDLTRTLRHSGYARWICRVMTADGQTMLIGDTDYPAQISFSGSDTQDSITLLWTK